jgi:tripartite-type tricarboxylate transporter receptor subunit TctC
MMIRTLMRQASAVALVSLLLPSMLFAQAYPSKPVRWIIPYAAGGSADTRARQLAQELIKLWGQPIIIENRPGAGAVPGTDLIAKAVPDGYTIGMGNLAPLTVNPTLFKSLPYDPIKDLAPVVLLEKGPLVLMVNPSLLPAKSVAELIALAKARPGTLSFASSGNGGSHHLSGEMFKSMAGIDINHIPYKGGAPAASDLMGGHVSMMFELMYSGLPAVKSGKLRALAVTSSQRLPVLPDVPTMAEAGLPGFESSNWQGIVVPAATPRNIVTKINADTVKVLNMREVHEKIVAQGNQVGGGTPEEFGALIRAETAKWGKVVREAGVRAD